MSKSPRKILFFRFDSRIGDSVVHSFFLRELKKLFPAAQLTVATFAPNEQFFENRPYVDKVKVLPPLPSAHRPADYLDLSVLYSLLRMLVHTYTGGYDFVIVNPVLATARNRFYSRLLAHAVCPRFDYTRHITHSYEQLLRHLGAVHIDTSYPNLLEAPHHAYARQFLQQQGLQPGQFWVVNPVGSMPCKTLGAEQLHALLEIFHQKQIPVLLLDYKNQFAHVSERRCTASSILNVWAVLAQAGGVVSVDTGIVHLADTCQKPMLVLYAHDKYGTQYNHIFWASRQRTTRWLQGTNTVQDIPTAHIQQTLMELLHPTTSTPRC